MLNIPGFEINSLIYQTAVSSVYRALRLSDSLPVILKLLSSPDPHPADITRLRNENEIIQCLDLPEVVKSYGLLNEKALWGLVLEDFGGVPLLSKTEDSAFSLDKFLKLAIGMSRVLGAVHARGVIHKDIKPANFLIHPVSRQIKLIDFGLSTRLSIERQAYRETAFAKETLAYISPELTGRVNRLVDYRTDLYSLGVSFYELLCGELPFQQREPLLMIYDHIAVLPPVLHEKWPEIPKQVSEIVHHLLAKNADDRYQSCEGLAADLEECLEQYLASGVINHFPLGRFDQHARFQPPQKFYGRAAEQTALLTFYEQIAIGETPVGLTLLGGEVGMGKTTLVQEFCLPLVRQGVYFISGQFPAIQGAAPYEGLIMALRGLIEQVLTETDAHLAGWRLALLDALGENAQVMLDILPELEMIIGPQPAVLELPDVQARNRLQRVFRNFIRVFTRAGHTLIVFLDDMQWSDAASQGLLENLVEAPDQDHLWIIVSYRAGELDQEHPLLRMAQRLEQAGKPVLCLNISPFNELDLAHWLADAFHLSLEQVLPLAEVVALKTGGNPFFTGEFVKTLVADNQIVFKEKGWVWDLEAVRACQITENVVDLVSANLQNLSLSTRQTLQRAACLGSSFELEMLARLSDFSSTRIATDLQQAVEEALIIPFGALHPLALHTTENALPRQYFSYMFAHDRIHQAVYKSLNESERRQIHHELGKRLWDSLAENELRVSIFDVVYHWNLGLPVVASPAEKSQLAEIFLLAGRQAKKTAAFMQAYGYFKAGLALLDEISWKNNYDLSLALHQETIESALSSGNAVQSGPIVEALLEHGRTLRDQLSAYQAKNKLLNSEHRPEEALDITIDVLARMGVVLARHPVLEDVQIGSQRILDLLSDRTIESLIDLPDMKDPDAQAAMKLLTSSTIVAFNASPALYNLISFERVRLSIQAGNSLMSPAGYASYGLYLCSQGDIEQGWAFGNLALKLVEKLNAQAYKARTWGTVYAFIYHWKAALRELLDAFEEAYLSGLEYGDFEFSSAVLVSYSYNALFSGVELETLKNTLNIHLERIQQFGHKRNAFSVTLVLQVVENMLGAFESPWVLKGQVFDEDTGLELLLRSKDQPLLFHFYQNKGILSYWFHQYALARQCFLEAEKTLSSVKAQSAFAVFKFYDSLTLLAVLPDLTPEEAVVAWDRVFANQQQLAFWAQFAPMNYQHKWLLVEAEKARCKGQYGEACMLYEQAVSLARENRFTGEEALANERAAVCYLEAKQPRLAHFAFQHAYDVYQQWGAQTKIEQMEKMYPEFFGRTSRPGPSLVDLRMTPAVQVEPGAVDFASLIKSLQALSGEFALEKLLGILMNTILENAGAQRGCLILEDNEHRWVKTAGDFSGLLPAPELSEVDPACMALSVIHYVFRTRENLILNHAALESKFARDPYIAKQQVKSLLCMPLLKQNVLVGVLYLENNLFTGAFTPRRLEFLRLLAAQAVLAIENARFYDTLEAKIDERTQELQQEITRRRMAEEQMKRLVITDPLTGVYNRRFFFELLESELQRAKRYQKTFVVLIFDLDHFKKINDVHGHLAGDKVLKTLTNLARANFRTVDTLARYGGEEFVVLLPETNLEQALLVTERVRSAIAACEVAVSSGVIKVTASFGITMFNPALDQSPDSILERADRALYQSKDSGRNRVSML